MAQAFGITSGFQNQVLDVELPSPLPEIVLVSGESGCGKSTLIRELGGETLREPPADVLLASLGDDRDRTLRVLNLCGLGEAKLFLLKYPQLSHSQKFRARVAYTILSGEETIIVDEFLSTLDRLTAKSVAYNFQKAVRRMGLKAVVATAHDDLEEYLQPSLTVTGKAFPSRWEVKTEDEMILDNGNFNPFLSHHDVYFKYQDADWYRENTLGDLHYRGKYTGGVKDYLAMFLDGRAVGVLIGKYRMHDGGRRISRLVVHPTFRGLGLGQEIVKQYLRDHPSADTVAAMARWNPVFEKAGMTRVNDVVVKPPSGLRSTLNNLDFDQEQWHDKRYCEEFANDAEHRECLAKFANHASHLVCPGGRNLDEDEIAHKITTEQQTAGRVLWSWRPKRMAKFIGPALVEETIEDGDNDN